ncbi:MAG: discoidin domain-containing protein [Bacteroidota bacterium]
MKYLHKMSSRCGINPKFTFFLFLWVTGMGQVPSSLAQEPLRLFNWAPTDLDSIFWKRLINCGLEEQAGGLENTQGASLTYGVLEEQRFPGTYSIKHYTNANFLEACNQNVTAERSEVHTLNSYRDLGIGEGTTVWFGWSEKWTELDDSHRMTTMQFRNNCGDGSPATQIMMLPGKRLQLVTGAGPVDIIDDIGFIEEDKWYDFVVEIKYSKGNDGYVKVWMHEACSSSEFSYQRPSAQILNNPNMYSDDNCPDIRWGIYRWESSDKVPSSIQVEDRIVIKYMGPVKLHMGANLGERGFEIVKPKAPVNLASNQPTRQSSTYGVGDASLAVDGDIFGTSPWTADLQHTQNESQPWWEVDLGQIQSLDYIHIYNRSDGYWERLKDFYLLVSSTPFEEGASLADHLTDESMEVIYFEGEAEWVERIPINTSGRYIRLQLSGTGILHIVEVEVTTCALRSGQCQGNELANLALNQSVSQSSTYGLGEPFFANDGIYTGNSPWTANLQHTQEEANPWWEVDLGRLSHIDRINIFNRSDQYQERLANFYILVSGAPMTGSQSLEDLLDDPSVQQIYFPGVAGIQEIFSIDLDGRYVRVQLVGRGTLHVSEVEIIGCQETLSPCGGSNFPNLALNQPSFQSSTYASGEASIANDGNTEGSSPWAADLQHTLPEENPWWEVDLRNFSYINHIQIFNRGDRFQERLGDFYVFISDSPMMGAASLQELLADSSRKAVHYPGEVGLEETIEVNTEGRYVRIQLAGTGILHVAEIVVKGCVLENSSSCQGNAPVNLALAQPTNQSSTYGQGYARYAVDGDSVGNSPWSANLQHTTREVHPWWEVDLGQLSELETIHLFNRSDDGQDRLRNFYILISAFPFSPGASLDDIRLDPAVKKVFFSGSAQAEEQITLNESGRYLRIQLSYNGILHMSEVEVLGCPIITQTTQSFRLNHNLQLVEQLRAPKISLFPNPAWHTVEMKVEDLPNDTSVLYQLINPRGQTVWQKVGNTAESVNVGGWTSGIYLLQVRGNNWQLTQALLIQ